MSISIWNKERINRNIKMIRNKLKNLICKFKKKCIQSERKQRKILLLYFRQFSILKCKNKYTKQFNILIGIEKLKNKTIKTFSTLVMNKLKVNQNGIKLRKLKSFHKSLEIKGINMIKKYFYKYRYIKFKSSSNSEIDYKKLFSFEKRLLSVFLLRHGKNFINLLNKIYLKKPNKKLLSNEVQIYKKTLISLRLKSRINYLHRFYVFKWLNLWSLHIFRNLKIEYHNLMKSQKNKNSNPYLKKHSEDGIPLELINLRRFSYSIEILYSQILKKTILPSFDKIRNIQSKNYIRQLLIKKIIRNLKVSRNLKKRFDSWKDKIVQIKITSLKFYVLRLLYNKIRNKIFLCAIMSRLRIWLENVKRKIVKSRHTNQEQLKEVVSLNTEHKNDEIVLKSSKNQKNTDQINNPKSNYQIITGYNYDQINLTSNFIFSKVMNMKQAFNKIINDLGRLNLKPKLFTFFSKLKLKRELKSGLMKILALRNRKCDLTYKKLSFCKLKKAVFHKIKLGFILKDIITSKQNSLIFQLIRKFKKWSIKPEFHKNCHNGQLISLKLLLNIKNFYLIRNKVDVLRKAFNKFCYSKIENPTLKMIYGIINFKTYVIRKGINYLMEKIKKKLHFKKLLKRPLINIYKLEVSKFFNFWKDSTKYLRKLKLVYLKRFILYSDKLTKEKYFNRLKIVKVNPTNLFNILSGICKLIKFSLKFFYNQLSFLNRKKHNIYELIIIVNKKILNFYLNKVINHRRILYQKRIHCKYLGFNKLLQFGYKIFFNFFNIKYFKIKNSFLRNTLQSTQKKYLNFYLQKIKMATFPNIDTIINFILSYQSLKKFSHRLFFNKLKFFLSNSKLKRVFLEKLLSLIRFKIRHEFMDKFKFHRTKLNVINNFLGLQKINRISYIQLFNKLRNYKIFSIKKNELLKKILCRKENQYIYFALKFWENSQFKYYITTIRRIKIQLLLKIKNIKEVSRTFRLLRTKIPHLHSQLLNFKQAFDIITKVIFDRAKLISKIKEKSKKKLPKHLIIKYQTIFQKLKIILLRKLYKKFKTKSNKISAGLSRKLKKIILLNKISLFHLFKYIFKWKHSITSSKFHLLQSKIKAKLIKNIYTLNKKSKALINSFLKWKYFVFPDFQSKFHIIAQKISKFTIINTNKRHLQTAIRIWISRIFNFNTKNDFFVKYRILKKLLTHKLNKINEIRKYCIKFILLRWKLFHCTTHDTKLSNVRLGNVFLQQIIRRKYLQFIKMNVSVKFIPNKKYILLRYLIEKCNEKFYNLFLFINKWRFQAELHYDLDATILKSKYLEICFEKPTSSILEKLRKNFENNKFNKSLFYNTGKRRQKFVMKIKIIFKIVIKFVVKIKEKFLVKFNLWRKLTYKIRINSNTKIIQEFIKKNFKKFRKKTKLNHLTSNLKDDNDKKCIFNSQTFLKNRFFLKLYVKMKIFIYRIENNKVRLLNANFKKWVRRNNNLKNEKYCRVIQKYLKRNLKQTKISFMLKKFIQFHSLKESQSSFKFWLLKTRMILNQSKTAIKITNFLRLVIAKRMLKLRKQKSLGFKLIKGIVFNLLNKEDGLNRKIFNRFKTISSRLKLNKNVQIIKKFICSKILKSITLKKFNKKKVEKRNFFIMNLCSNHYKIFSHFLVFRYLHKWISIISLIQVKSASIFFSLNKKLMIKSLRNICLYPPISRLDNKIKYPVYKETFKQLKSLSLMKKGVQKNKKLGNNIVHLRRKLEFKIKVVFNVWRNDNKNSILNKKAKIIQNFIKLMKNRKNEKEKNRKIYRKKVSFLSTKFKNLLINHEQKSKLEIITNSFIVWVTKRKSNKSFRSSRIKSKENQITFKLLNNIIKRYEDKIFAIKSIFISIWLNIINHYIFNEKSCIIQRFLKKEMFKLKLKVSQVNIFNFAKAISDKKIAIKRLSFTSKFFRSNLIIEKLIKKKFLTNYFYLLVKNKSRKIFEKVHLNFRKRLLRNFKIFSKFFNLNRIIENMKKKQIINYIINDSRKYFIWKFFSKTYKLMLINNLLKIPKIYLLKIIFKKLFIRKHFNQICKFLSFKIRKFNKLINKFVNLKRKKQLNLLDQFSNSFKLNIELIKKLKLLFQNKINKFSKLYKNNLLIFLKFYRLKILKNQNLKLEFSQNLISKIKKIKILKQINQFFMTYRVKITFLLISRFIKIFKLIVRIKNTFKKQFFTKIVKLNNFTKISSFLHKIFYKIKIKFSKEFKKFTRSYRKNFYYFKGISIGKEKLKIISHVNLMFMALKLRAKNKQNLFSFLKFYKFCEITTSIIKINAFNMIFRVTLKPKIKDNFFGLYKITCEEQKKFYLFNKIFLIEDMIKNVLKKFWLRTIIHFRIRGKILKHRFSNFSEKLKIFTLNKIMKNIKRTKEITKMMISNFNLFVIILKKMMIKNLFKLLLKLKELKKQKSKIYRFNEILKRLLFRNIIKNENRLKQLNNLSKKALKLKTTIRKVILRSIIPKLNNYQVGNENVKNTIHTKFYFKINSIFIFKIRNYFNIMMKSNEKFSKKYCKFSNMMEGICNFISFIKKLELKKIIHFLQKQKNKFEILRYSILKFNFFIKKSLFTKFLKDNIEFYESKEKSYRKTNFFKLHLRKAVYLMICKRIHQIKEFKYIFITNIYKLIYTIKKALLKLILRHQYKIRQIYEIRKSKIEKFISKIKLIKLKNISKILKSGIVNNEIGSSQRIIKEKMKKETINEIGSPQRILEEKSNHWKRENINYEIDLTEEKSNQMKKENNNVLFSSLRIIQKKTNHQNKENINELGSPQRIIEQKSNQIEREINNVLFSSLRNKKQKSNQIEIENNNIFGSPQRIIEQNSNQIERENINEFNSPQRIIEQKSNQMKREINNVLGSPLRIIEQKSNQMKKENNNIFGSPQRIIDKKFNQIKKENFMELGSSQTNIETKFNQIKNENFIELGSSQTNIENIEEKSNKVKGENIKEFGSSKKIIKKSNQIEREREITNELDSSQTIIIQNSIKLKRENNNESAQSNIEEKSNKKKSHQKFYLKEILKKSIAKTKYNNTIKSRFHFWRSYNYLINRFINKVQLSGIINLHSKLIKWKRIRNIFNAELASKTIQLFIFKRLLRIKNKVFEKKESSKEMNIRGLIKLSSIIKKLPFKEVFRKIRQEKKRRILISFLHYLKCKKSSYLKRFMIHFKKTFKLKNKQYALAVNKVILIFKNSVFRKNIKKLLIKIKFIQKLLLKKFTKKNYLLSTSVNKWLRKIKAICFLNAQRYLQLFMRKKLNFLIVKKYNNRIIIKQLFRDYLVLKKIKPFFKEFVTFKFLLKGLKSFSKCIFMRLISNIKFSNSLNEKKIMIN